MLFWWLPGLEPFDVFCVVVHQNNELTKHWIAEWDWMCFHLDVVWVCILQMLNTETEMSSFWWNFHHWLHWKLSKWQLPVQPVMKISSKWRHFRFSECHISFNDMEWPLGIQCLWVAAYAFTHLPEMFLSLYPCYVWWLGCVYHGTPSY